MSKKKKKFGSKPNKNRAERLASEARKQRRVKIFLLVFGIVSACAVLGVIVFGIVTAVLNSQELDAMNDDLDRYIEISRDDYMDYPVSIRIDPIDDVAVESALIRALCASRIPDSTFGAGKHNIKDTEYMRDLAAGDKVYAYYLGYELVDGVKHFFSGGSNLASSTITDDKAIDIGGGKLFTGFEVGLVGQNPWAHSPLVRHTSGTVKRGDIVCFEMEAIYSDGSVAELASYVTVADPAVCDAVYGSGFADFLIGKEVGEIDDDFRTMDVSDKSGYSAYTSMKITTICEAGDDPITVEARVPVADTGTGLAGKTVYFDVFVEKVQYFEVPEVDEEFVLQKLGMSAAELSEFGEEGDELIDCYRAYLEDNLYASARYDAEEIIVDTFWEWVLDRVEVKRLPRGTVNEYYDDYIRSITESYSSNSQITTLDDYAIDYLELEPGDDWRAEVRRVAEEEVASKVIFYYIVREEELFPTDEEYQQIFDQIVDDLLEYYLLMQDITEDAYDDAAEYEAAVLESRQMIIDSYGQQYFDDNVLYEYAMEKIIDMADVRYE